jgi:hypothetical protein
MSLPVVTVASRGLPVVEAVAGKLALPVIEATNGRGLAVTKVFNGLGLPVVYETAVVLGALVSPNNMTSNVLPAPYVASASSEFSAGFAAFRTFNSTLNTSWASGNLSTLPQWVKIDLGSAKAASSYTVQTRTDAVVNQPTAWTLEGSLNDSTWTTADTRSGIAAIGAGGVMGPFAMTTPGTYRYWRWTFTAALAGSAAYSADCGNLALYA